MALARSRLGRRCTSLTPGSRVPPTHVPPPGSLGESVGPHTLQILMTEHWSLLAHRGFTYTETLGRTSIFVAALTGSVVSLALVAQATEVGDSFVAFALVLLPVVYFLGRQTFVRLIQVNWEDTRWVQGMNRIRHAYLDLAPELEPYFVTSRYDDDLGILQSAVAMRKWPSPAQGLVAIAGVVGVIDSVVAGAIAGIALPSRSISAQQRRSRWVVCSSSSRRPASSSWETVRSSALETSLILYSRRRPETASLGRFIVPNPPL